MVPSETITISSEKIQRSIGRIEGNLAGNTIAFFAGIHGNEPAGILALERVICFIEEYRIPFHGDLWALQGNLPALREKKRFLDKDLNRIWLTRYNDTKIIQNGISEIEQMTELKSNIRDILNQSEGEVYFFDLHTTSSQSIPFISISDTLRNRSVVKNIPVPLVLGLEEQMEGTLFSFFSELGISMILFEAGQHESVSSVDNHEAFIWLVLSGLGFISTEDVTDIYKYREILAKESIFNKRIFQLKYSHLLKDENNFKMLQGFVNFQAVKKGEILAEDNNGKVTSPMKGRIFMPLYQNQGGEGYFIIREINRFWLKLSIYFRRLGLDRFMNLIPGVRKDKNLPECFRVHKLIAGFFILDFFHLLGYRKVVRKDNKFIVKRRPFDQEQPHIETVLQRFHEITETELE